jgi:AcrR family transcriptional regulator
MASRRSRTRKRAPRGSLSREALVRTALDLMRGQDAPPLTIQRVADAMNTRPMSLYSHIENREDLANAVADLALEEWTFDVEPDAVWEDQIRGWCRSLRSHVRRCPALVWDIARRGKFQPSILEKVAILSRSLRAAGLEGAALADLLRWIPQTALGAVVLELSRPGDLQSGGDEASAVYASINALSSEDRAELADVLLHYSRAGLDDLFEYSIDRIIDGVRIVAENAQTAQATPDPQNAHGEGERQT